MKQHIMNYLSQMGYPVSSFEHTLLEKFAAFVAASEQAEPVVETPVVEAPVVETPAVEEEVDKAK